MKRVMNRKFDWLGKKWSVQQLIEEYGGAERTLYQRLRINNWIVTKQILDPAPIARNGLKRKNRQGVSLGKIEYMTGLSRGQIDKKLGFGYTIGQVVYGVFGVAEKELSFCPTTKLDTGDGWRMAFKAFPVGRMTCNRKTM